MPFAITLRLDPISAVPIEAIWRKLAVDGIDTDRYQLGYAPHITLAIYPDETPFNRLRTALEDTSRNWQALPIGLSGLGAFPGDGTVLWAVPVVTFELLARHQAIQTALPDLKVDAHYRPGAWVPHVTLSGALPDPGPALMALLSSWEPITGFLDRVELVRFRPVEVLYSSACGLSVS
ncbi:2'-5' RNA ligase family protein [Bradyrhizobium sp. 186]|uniref:2'-5' RNA ligase family protein n=1 Tax=Bradyrhizobium sp. 186 TaxID=2782654 RepID=UPI0020017D14|nr:2'-5' RNA ligase family protein [Bradyrhizobium sp. 186]UPK32198.1 2'-5' RNA ligase family protein [Bradyrhizobium sp. 186]